MKAPIGWLEQQLDEWVDASLVSSENAAKIRARYTEGDMDRPNRLMMIFAIFGALLIGTGFISIFAYNWEELSRAAKAVIAFVLLGLAIAFAVYAKLRKEGSAAYAEGVAIFWSVAFVGAFAIIAQTYNLGGDLVSFVQFTTAMTLPILYIFNSRGVAALSFMAIVALICSSPGDGGSAHTISWLLMIAWLAWYIWRLIFMRFEYTTIVFNLLFALGMLAVFNIELNHLIVGYELFFHALYCGFFWLASALLYPKETRFYRKPIEEFSKFAIAIVLLILSIDGDNSWLLGNGYIDYWEIDNALFFMLCAPYLAMLGFFIAKYYKERSYELFFPVAPFLIFFATEINLSSDESGLIFTLFTAIGAVLLIVNGTKQLELWRANQGIMLLSILILIKFFDSDLGFLEKGVGFIVIGTLFLGANWLMNRFIKKQRKVMQ
ncbi:hypothetical protein AGMMS49521_0660 [Campylobacterota bacterium]|nr:hypothetical protein AGMMS49521_0660 [Campylobacterota bacterium]